MKLLKLNDQELVARIKADNIQAFEALYYRYFDRLARYAFKRLQDEETAEEIVQDVFVDLWKKREGFDTDCHVDGLLFAMLRNKALHVLRSRMIAARHLDNVTQLNAIHQFSDENEALYAKQLQEKLDRIISGLSPQCREAFTLSRYEQLSYKDIATRMGISVNTVEKHIGKALGTLRKEFTDSPLPILLFCGFLKLCICV